MNKLVDKCELWWIQGGYVVAGRRYSVVAKTTIGNRTSRGLWPRSFRVCFFGAGAAGVWKWCWGWAEVVFCGRFLNERGLWWELFRDVAGCFLWAVVPDCLGMAEMASGC